MNNDGEKDLIRRYLLLELSDDEMTEVEERLLTDDMFFNQVLSEEEEMIDEYVYERMAPRSRARFEASYLSTPEGREQVNLARSLIEYTLQRQTERTIPVKSRLIGLFSIGDYRISSLKFAASIIILLGLGFVIWQVFFSRSDVDAGMQALNQAYSRQRAIEGRVTAIDHAPLATTRGVEDAVDSFSRSRAESILRNAVSRNPGAESHHALGRLYLMEGDFDRAIEEFKAALSASERNAQLHSDLGAAFLEKGKAEIESGTGDGKEPLLEALNHLSRAIEIDASLAEAFFNRGFLYKQMGEAEQAVADWKRYLEVDPTSKWADEVKENIKVVEQ